MILILGGCKRKLIVGLGWEWLVDDGFGCMFGRIHSTIERFSSTRVSYLFDVATVYVYSFESAITVESCDEAS